MARLSREKRTVASMIAIYCRGHHGGHHGPAKGLCEECRTLQEYAFARLDRCPFGKEKPTCANCTIHCYKPAMREKARAVMRYAGPRMIWRHPIRALCHLLDSRRRAPAASPEKQASPPTE